MSGSSNGAASLRPDLHSRFREVVARAIARADAEQAAHFARLRATGPKYRTGRDGRLVELQARGRDGVIRSRTLVTPL